MSKSLKVHFTKKKKKKDLYTLFVLCLLYILVAQHGIYNSSLQIMCS